MDCVLFSNDLLQIHSTRNLQTMSFYFSETYSTLSEKWHANRKCLSNQCLIKNDDVESSQATDIHIGMQMRETMYYHTIILLLDIYIGVCYHT